MVASGFVSLGQPARDAERARTEVRAEHWTSHMNSHGFKEWKEWRKRRLRSDREVGLEFASTLVCLRLCSWELSNGIYFSGRHFKYVVDRNLDKMYEYDRKHWLINSSNENYNLVEF